MLRTAGIGNFPASRIPWQRKYGDKAAGVVLGPLSDVIASAVFDLDATMLDSYSGSGTTWANLIPTPADGAAQTAYDFKQGDDATSSLFPTFNGTPGDPAAYWSFDGGDFFRIPTAVGSLPAFIRNINRTTGGSDFWIATCFRVVAGATIQDLFAIRTTTTTSRGIMLRITGAELVDLTQRGDAGPSSTTAAGALTNGADYCVICSYSVSEGKARFWINSGTMIENVFAFNTTSSQSLSPPTIGAEARSTAPSELLNNGTRMYSFAMGNEFLDNTKAATIINALEARHSRDYTP